MSLARGGSHSKNPTGNWRLAVALLAACPLIFAACSNSASPSGQSASNTSSANGSANSNPNSSSSVSSTSTTQPAQTPELVVCTQGQYFAVPPGSSGTVSPLVSVSQGNSNVNDDCTPLSADLTKVGATESVTDGSTDAGYVSISTGSFTDLSGHTTDNYSGSTVDDQDPEFAPSTGDLWWVDNGGLSGSSVFYAPISGGSVTPWPGGGGSLNGFTPSGQGSPVQVFASPSGNSLAVAGGCGGYGCSQTFAVGTPTTLTGQCLGSADYSFGNFGVPQSCPSVASGTLPLVGESGELLGLSSDTTAVILSGNNALYSVPFSVSGATVSFGTPVQLTPPTSQTLSNAILSPDGQTIWYFGTQPSGSGSAVYEVSSSTATANPQGFSPTVSASSGSASVATFTGGSLAAGSVLGWYWKGQFVSDDS